ncbi:MAG: SDR family NAD(P)-dependent oxidoreductase, partial [Chitinophagales bacterium]
GSGFTNENYREFNLDISDEEAVDAAYKKSLDFLGGIDIVINNAGFGHFAKTDECDSDTWRKMFDVNVNGLFYLTKRALKDMKKAQHGHFINVSSIAGTTGIEQAAGYCGTKHAVRGISHSLYKEVKKDNIKVTCVYPGSVNTHFFDEVEGTKANDTMLHADDVAKLFIQLLESPDNFNTLDVEIRPMNPVYS